MRVEHLTHDTTMVNLIPPPTFDVQDLWFHITGFLHGRTRDLKSCALVSRSLCPAAQSVLFRNIDVAPNYPIPPIVSDGKVSAAYGPGGHSLVEVLTTSPHLRNYIHRLRIEIKSDPHVLIQLGGMGFSSLRHFSFLDQRKTLETQEGLIKPLQNLIGLPTLREVGVIKYLSTRIFSGHISHLNRLAFDRVDYISLDGPTPEVGGARPEIAALRLEDSPVVDAWLVDSRCPFDFTRLVDVQITGRYPASDRHSSSNPFVHLLQIARTTITHLALDARNLEKFNLNLGQFPALTHLHTVAVYGEDFRYMPSGMPSLEGHPTIRFITVKIIHFNDLEEELRNPDTEAKLRDTDTILAGSLPLLQNVGIQWDAEGYSNSLLSVSETTVLFQMVFPALHTRGLLTIKTTTTFEHSIENRAIFRFEDSSVSQ
ncbi:hypothetical protein B0H19DRAFT_119373 [Mycena capillaripes]|nr:hypothetical protein B0H19DRAFT_119373 [Mycena capillaripes]